jgi:RimJ/RimL family protein N-acetyltransferase
MDVMEKIESGEFGEGYGIWCSVLRDRRPVMVGAVGCAPGKDGEGAILDFETLPEFEGQGYATEGAQALMGWLMGHEGLKKITADVDGEEGAAIRVLLKLGFAEKGRSADGKKLHFEAVAR